MRGTRLHASARCPAPMRDTLALPYFVTCRTCEKQACQTRALRVKASLCPLRREDGAAARPAHAPRTHLPPLRRCLVLVPAAACEAWLAAP